MQELRSLAEIFDPACGGLSYVMSETTGTDWCVYCGDYFECRDHVIPVSYQSPHRYYNMGEIVKCCSECNRYLGNNAVHTVQDRADFLKTEYIRRKSKWLRAPHWTEEEIGQLGYSLRTEISKFKANRALYFKKIENLERSAMGYEPLPISPLIRRGKSSGCDWNRSTAVESPRVKMSQTIRDTVRKNLKHGFAYYSVSYEGRSYRALSLRRFCSRHNVMQKKLTVRKIKFSHMGESHVMGRIREMELSGDFS